ncbi:MAG: alpha/beta fold hydrolase [Desulfobacterium sp.]|jgi:haloalkane dehalogenase|nr:alpha/beta fold hydrolase [Desulfobacterium sp.]
MVNSPLTTRNRDALGRGIKRKINGVTLDTEEFKELYPFTPNFITLNSHKLHYLDKGKGSPVVMVHGNPTWSFYFRTLVRDLSRSHRVIVPDHIGCGLSDKPSEKEYDYTLESRVRDLDSLIKSLELDRKITLVVHDWGGMIGCAWALKNLDRIERIVVTNTSGFHLPLAKRFPLRLWLIKYLTWFAVPAVLGLNLFSRAALYMAPVKSLSPKVKKGLTAPYNSWKNRITTLKFVQDIPLSPKDQSHDLVTWVDSNLDRLKTIPIMILWGRHDFVFDLSFYDEWKRRFPNAQTHVFNDAGHYLFEDKPVETSNLIGQFLKDSSG